MMHLKMAFLNLFRNKRRTLSSMVSLILALTAVILFEGFAQSMYDGMRESMIRSQLGHIQIYAKGFSQFGALQSGKLLLDEQDKTEVKAIAESLPGVKVVTHRLEADLLIATDTSQMAAKVEGIDPDKESVVSSAIQVLSGSSLFKEHTNGVLLGQELADALGVMEGDTLTLLGSTVHQSMNVMDVEVVGTVTTGVKERDLRTAWVNTELVEQFILSEGASRVVMLLDTTEATDSVLQQLNQRLSDMSDRVEVKTWSELATYYHQVVTLFDFIFLFIKAILFLVAGFSIFYALSLNVVERTNEIGVIRALGGSRTEVCSIFVTEGFVLGLIGALLGLGVSIISADILNQSGWMMPTPPGSTVTYPMGFLIEPKMALQQLGIIVCIALAGSFLPAFRASQLQIARALDYV